jgi:hypothetical protein
MNAKNLIAAAAIFLSTASVFAADAAGTEAAAVVNSAAASAVVAVTASNLNLPVVSISQQSGRSRADVHAEAVQFVKQHKTTLAVQLEQYKN